LKLFKQCKITVKRLLEIICKFLNCLLNLMCNWVMHNENFRFFEKECTCKLERCTCKSEKCMSSNFLYLLIIVIVIVIVIHTLLWHRFRLNSWETLCYLYWVNKILWERKSLVVYTTASCSRNNEIDTVLSSNEFIASIQRVMLK